MRFSRTLPGFWCERGQQHEKPAKTEVLIKEKITGKQVIAIVNRLYQKKQNFTNSDTLFCEIESLAIWWSTLAMIGINVINRPNRYGLNSVITKNDSRYSKKFIDQSFYSDYEMLLPLINDNEQNCIWDVLTNKPIQSNQSDLDKNCAVRYIHEEFSNKRNLLICCNSIIDLTTCIFLTSHEVKDIENEIGIISNLGIFGQLEIAIIKAKIVIISFNSFPSYYDIEHVASLAFSSIMEYLKKK